MLIPLYLPKDLPILRVVVQELQIQSHRYQEQSL